jgi:hypothetical protein
MAVPFRLAPSYTALETAWREGQNHFIFARSFYVTHAYTVRRKEASMAHDEEPIVKSPTEARGGVKKGIWKILAISIVLAIIAMVLIGQGTPTPTG